MSPSNLVRSRRARLSALVACVAIGLSACGGDDSDESAGSSSTTEDASAGAVTLTATEYEFDLSTTPTADTQTVDFVNDGEEPHVLVFAKLNQGFTVDEAVKLEGKKGSAVLVGEGEAKPGESATVEVKQPLEPGHYVMLCVLTTKDGEPHYKLGQLQEFDIE